MKGLVRKYYLFDEQSRIGGGVYLWKSRADADAVYTAQWKAYIAERYGAPPDIRYFETAVVVDNESDKILGRRGLASTRRYRTTVFPLNRQRSFTTQRGHSGLRALQV